jgi:alpha/beta superfamily hydrolase
VYWVGNFEERAKPFVIDGPVGELEGVAMAPAEDKFNGGYVAVICHPHPLHGGAMGNKVVTSIARGCRDMGVPSAVFNFRGVGASEGVFDSAVGEVEDLQSVIEWVRRCYPKAKLLLAGFSFGSSVAAQFSHRCQDAVGLILIAPPVDRYSYDVDARFSCPLLVLMGEEDELVDVDDVINWGNGLKSDSELVLFAGASHFFHGKLVDLKKALVDHVGAWLAV